MIMNHGLINISYYVTEGKVYEQELYEAYPELLVLKNYFSRLNARHLYYVVMKRHALQIARSIYPKITLTQLAEIVNLTNHTSILNLEKNFAKPYDYDDFIKNFHYYIENFYYPITEKNKKKKYEECFYKLTYIEPKKTEVTKKNVYVGKEKIKRGAYGNKKIPSKSY